MNKSILLELLKTEARKLVGNLETLDKFKDRDLGKQKIRGNVKTINELLNALDEAI